MVQGNTAGLDISAHSDLGHYPGIMPCPPPLNYNGLSDQHDVQHVVHDMFAVLTCIGAELN